MCGRYASTRSSADLATLFDAADFTQGRLDASFNLAPTDSVPIIRMSRSADARVVSAARWGLVPPWSDSPSVGVRMINARSESVTTSRAYRGPFARKRCLVPADGWYEWRKLGGGRKQPYFTTAKQDRPLVFAGLWETWGGDENRLMTCTVLTTPAVGELHEIHDRMPLLLEADSHRDWLEDRDAAEHLLHGVDEQSLKSLEIRPVGKAVGNVANDGPQLVDRVDVLESGPPMAKEEQQQTLF
ncbi:putative SOS response-associated peptidase YedK [Stackebrandtia endophytica]|uniref:Abasic site processing protein n=1 Tax=Stackebrandtia endophytica TaxID=1496996 RepID=A0A543B234_9ACTN|nr:SOS response-associated peptidase [Stackebrandtia endophytica]TQL78884.1 putative SOS response-associated peptidase YedK [Stackebrandtia endophytica]